MGLFNILILWPFFLVLHFSGIEPFELPSKLVFGLMLLNAFVGSFLCDYLWLLSMLMTSPVVVTLGLSLTIPLAVISDFIQGKFEPTLGYWIGTIMVLSGFLFVNVGTITSSVDNLVLELIQKVWRKCFSGSRSDERLI